MRIVVNGWFLDQLATGSGQYLGSLATALPRAGANSKLIIVAPRKPQMADGGRQPRSQKSDRDPGSAIPSAWQLVFAGTPFDRISRNLAKLWFEQITFPQACRRLVADVALVPYWGSPWWRACPTAVTIHDLIPLLLPLYRGGLPQRAYTWLVAHTARRADAILTDSEASRRDVIAHLHIPPDRVHAVHLAAEEDFKPVTDLDELARVRAKYALPAEPFFLYLGGFDARKNVVRMIEAYAKMTVDDGASVTGKAAPESGTGDRGQGIRLVIAGALPKYDSAFAPDPMAVVKRMGIEARVHFAGWVDEVDKPALYSLARGALYPSEYEGFGLPVVEAMASGCPVVAGAG
jgi:glycosyltransferase involved in cell wall biosynthesis